MKRGAPRYEPHVEKLIAEQLGKRGAVKPKKLSKYHAVKTEFMGRLYDSKKEANYAAQLQARKEATDGDVLDWLEQVPVRLKTIKATYRIDFQVFFRNGTTKFVEVKGAWTREARLKMNAFESEHPALFALLEVV